MMDIDNLQGVCIHIVYKMKYSGIIADYFLINDFVSKHVELSSRSIFLNVIKGSVDYLLDQYEQMKESPDQEQSIKLFHREETKQNDNSVVEYDPKDNILTNTSPDREELTDTRGRQST